MAFEDTLHVCDSCKVVHGTQGSAPFECSVCGESRFNEIDPDELLG